MSSDTSVREATVARPERHAALSTRAGLVGSAVVLVAMVAAVLALVAPVAPVPVALWLLTLLTLPGLAMLPRRAELTAAQWWGAVVSLSVVVEVFGYVVMLWSTIWQPRALAFLVLVASANVIAVRVLVPWWTRTTWDSPLQRRLSGAAIALTVGGALALALGLSRRPSSVGPVDPAPETPRTGGWVLVADDGREVPLDGTVTVGRTRSGDADAVGDHELTLVDGTRTMSRRHLVLSVEPDGVLLVDQGSLNGFFVLHPSDEVETCPPGGQLLLADGDVVEIAERRLTLLRR